MDKRELQAWVDQEGGPASFVFSNALGPGDFPDGTPDTVVQALERLWGQATADLKLFTGWLHTEQGPAPGDQTGPPPGPDSDPRRPGPRAGRQARQAPD